MPQFRFRLATLQKLREALRDQRRSALAEAQHALDLLDEQLARVAAEFQELRRRYQSAARPGALEVDRLVEVQRYELVLRAEQQRFEQQRETIRAEVERRREALVAADREVKVLEKLREKQETRHRREDDQREMKRIDEVAGRRHVAEEAR